MSTHLLETSVLTRYRRPEIQRAIEPYIGNAARCTMTDLELAFSASNVREWDDWHDFISEFEPIDVTPAVMDRAKTVQRWLAQRGLKGRKVPDLIIAAAADLANLTLLHYDHDFEIIASVTGQQHAWIVPPGTIS